MTKTKSETPQPAATGDSNPFAALGKMFEQLTVPGANMAEVFETQRKGIDALVEANRSAWESMQALARKQTETLTQAVQRMQEAMVKAASGGLGDPVKQVELIRGASEKTLADVRELAEMARKSQADALAGITKRANEQMQELQGLLQRTPQRS
jgi:phasin family protein